jgi:hypothetical protein
VINSAVPEQQSETPFERFKRLTARVIAVPRTEIQKREIKYKEQRKIKSQHRHR